LVFVSVDELLQLSGMTRRGKYPMAVIESGPGNFPTKPA
jgi:hypothetical protein